MSKMYMIGKTDPMPLIHQLTQHIYSFQLKKTKNHHHLVLPIHHLHIQKNAIYLFSNQQVFAFDQIIAKITKSFYSIRPQFKIISITHQPYLNCHAFLTKQKQIYILKKQQVSFLHSWIQAIQVKYIQKNLIIIGNQSKRIVDQNGIIREIKLGGKLWQKGVINSRRLFGIGVSQHGELGLKSLLRHKSDKLQMLFLDEQLQKASQYLESKQCQIPFLVDDVKCILNCVIGQVDNQLYEWGCQLFSETYLKQELTLRSKSVKKITHFYHKNTPAQLQIHNFIPKHIPLDFKVRQFSTSSVHLAVLTQACMLFSCGLNQGGCLGYPRHILKYSKQLISVDYLVKNEIRLEQIKCGQFFTIGIMDNVCLNFSFFDEGNEDQGNFKISEIIFKANQAIKRRKGKRRQLHDFSSGNQLKKNCSLPLQQWGRVYRATLNAKFYNSRQEKKIFEQKNKDKDYFIRNDIFQQQFEDFLMDKLFGHRKHILTYRPDKRIQQLSQLILPNKVEQVKKKSILKSYSKFNLILKSPKNIEFDEKGFRKSIRAYLNSYDKQKSKPKDELTRMIETSRSKIKKIEFQLLKSIKKVQTQRKTFQCKVNVKIKQNQGSKIKKAKLIRTQLECKRKNQISKRLLQKKLTIRKQNKLFAQIYEKKAEDMQSLLNLINTTKNIQNIIKSMSTLPAIVTFKNRRLSIITKVQRIIHEKLITKHLQAMKRTDKLSYLRFKIRFRFILIRLKQKKMFRKVQNLVSKNLTNKFHKRCLVGIDRFRSNIENIQRFIKYISKMRQRSIGSLAFSFDQQLIKRSEKIANSMSHQVERLFQNDKLLHSINNKIFKSPLNYSYIPPLQSHCSFKHIIDLSIQNLFQDGVYENVKIKNQQIFGQKLPRMDYLSCNLRQYFSKGYRVILGQTQKKEIQVNNMLKKLSIRYFSKTKEPQLYLKPTKYFCNSPKLDPLFVKELMQSIDKLQDDQFRRFKKNQDQREKKQQKYGFVSILVSSVHLGKILPNKIQDEQKIDFLRLASQISQQLFVQFLKYQIQVKYNLLFEYNLQIRKLYKKQLDRYIILMNQFACQHKQQINRIRARLMLKCSSQMLEKLILKFYQKYKLQLQNGCKVRRIIWEDFLPFGTIVFNIAETLRDAPKKPKLQIIISDFGDLFKQYLRKLKILKQLSQNSFYLRKRKF